MARSLDFRLAPRPSARSAAPALTLRRLRPSLAHPFARFHRIGRKARPARTLAPLARARAAAFLAVVGLASTALAASPRTAGDPYPPERRASVVRFYSLDGELKVEALRKAIAELSTKEVESRIVGDPMVSSTRPKLHYIALETPATATIQVVENALRKSNARVQALAWTLFQGATKGPTPILGYSGRDCVIGMSSDMRWFDFAGDASSFYYVPGKLRAAKLEDLYRTLYQPLGGGELGKLSRPVIQWSLKAPVDEAAARRAEKTIAKLDGVREAKIDAAAGSLRMTVELDGLKTSAPMGVRKEAIKLDATGEIQEETIATPRFDTNPVLDVLAKEAIAILPRKD